MNINVKYSKIFCENKWYIIVLVFLNFCLRPIRIWYISLSLTFSFCIVCQSYQNIWFAFVGISFKNQVEFCIFYPSTLTRFVVNIKIDEWKIFFENKLIYYCSGATVFSRIPIYIWYINKNRSKTLKNRSQHDETNTFTSTNDFSALQCKPFRNKLIRSMQHQCCSCTNQCNLKIQNKLYFLRFFPIWSLFANLPRWPISNDLYIQQRLIALSSSCNLTYPNVYFASVGVLVANQGCILYFCHLWT